MISTYKKKEPLDPLMRGYKLAISVSMPSALLGAIEKYALENEMSMSWSITRLSRLGLTYTNMLRTQAREKLEEIASKPEKKKPKRKTPSKKK